MATEVERVIDLVATRRLLRDGVGKQIRLAAGLSVREMAAAVGCDVSALARWEAGDRVPRAVNAERYIGVLRNLLRASDVEAELKPREDDAPADLAQLAADQVVAWTRILEEVVA